MALKNIPKFPYGAVYFRKSNPPREDWERDYKTASEDGMNIFRHWFLWSAVEIKPGEYNWEDYDRQLDLAAKYGLKTIIAEMITSAPEWAFRDLAYARLERIDGSKIDSHMSASCVTGGFPGLCLDNEEVLALAERFLTELVKRYRNHPGLGGYDIWNECNYLPDVCYCPATQKKFRLWLQKKYKDIKTLSEVWHRYGYRDWEDVSAPRSLGPYPDVIDWLQFRIENAYELMQWRADLIKKLDPDHPVTAHGIVGTLTHLANCGADDWKAAERVEVYGYTWGACRHGNEPWKQWHAVDIVRCASKGKPFWHAEAYGGPLWMQPQVINKPRDEGRIARPKDIRIWNMVSFAGGARGLFYLRWRPLLDGPLFGAFGPYNLDGSRTDRSEMVSRIAKWVNAPEQEALWKSQPVKGDIGILIIPETEIFCYAQQGNTEYYANSLRGTYQGFFDNNIQADWVRIEDIDNYDLLYLPFPVMLTKEIAHKLIEWVKKGGKLVVEGCPAYFGDNGRVCTIQPGLGFDKILGVREKYVEFTPDLLNNLIIKIDNLHVYGGIFLQSYDVTTGKPVGWYEDGSIAAVENQYGDGKTLLIGSFPGYGYNLHPGSEGRLFFSNIIRWAGKEQHIKSSDQKVTARLHDGEGGMYLWLTNPSDIDIKVEITFSQKWGPFKEVQILWGDEKPEVDGRKIKALVKEHDALVCKLIK